MPRRSIFSLWVLFFVLMLTVGSVVSAQDRFSFGQPLPNGCSTLEQELFLSVIVMMDNQRSRIQEKATLSWTLDVSERENGSGLLVGMKLSRIMFQVWDDTRDLSQLMYDSNRRALADEATRAFYEGLLDAEFSVALKSDHSVESVLMPEGFPDSVAGANVPEDSEVARMLPSIRNLLSGRTLSETVQQMFTLLPSEEVAVGDQWTHETEIDLPVLGKTPVHWQCRWDRLESQSGRRFAVLAGTGKLALDAQTDINSELTVYCDQTTGFCAKAASRSVVSKTKTIQVQGVEKKAKTIGMVRSNLTLNPLGARAQKSK